MGTTAPEAAQVYPLLLRAGRIYRLSVRILSGTRDEGTGSGNLTTRFIDSNETNVAQCVLGINDTYASVDYAPEVDTQVTIRYLWARLMTCTDLKLEVLLRDVTEETTIDTLETSIAYPYNNTKIYKLGDYCFYNGMLYYCAYNMTAAEEWDASHWMYAYGGVSALERTCRGIIANTAPTIGTEWLPWRIGHYVSDSTSFVGETLHKSNSANFVGGLCPCSPGDIFYVTLEGGTGVSRGWFFADADMKILSGSYPTAGYSAIDRKITAPANAAFFAYANDLTERQSGYYAYKGEAIKDSVNEVQNKLNMVDTQINSLHNLINYGYDNPVDKEIGGIPHAAIRNGIRVTINYDYEASSTGTRFVINTSNLNTFSSSAGDTGTITLEEGHTYRYRLHHVSGTASNKVLPWIVKKGAAGTSSNNNVSEDPATGDLINTFTYSAETYPGGVMVIIYINRASTGNTLVNYTVDATLEDITNGSEDLAFSNIASIEGDTATTTHAVDDLIVYKHQLYKVTAAIATGETLVPGTNISETTINDKLAEKVTLSDVDALTAWLDPEMTATRNLYIQNGTTNANYKTVTINNGLIDVKVGTGVTTNYCTIFITGEFSSTYGTNLASTIPPINSVLPIEKMNAINYLETYTESEVTANSALMLIIFWCSVEDDTVTKLSHQSTNLSKYNGENVLRVLKLNIPEGATHYAMAVYHSNKNDVAGKSATARIKFCYLPETTESGGSSTTSNMVVVNLKDLDWNYAGAGTNIFEARVPFYYDASDSSSVLECNMSNYNIYDGPYYLDDLIDDSASKIVALDETVVSIKDTAAAALSTSGTDFKNSLPYGAAIKYTYKFVTDID